MEYKQVRTFVTVARYLHFGLAAEHLRVAQPHVSRRIKQLEEELGVTLFYRDKRNVRLSEAGEVFLEEAHRVLHDTEVAIAHTRESALGRRGKLRVSLVGSAMLGVLPTILGEFRRRYPDVHLVFAEVGSIVQLDALIHGTTDVAFFHPPNRATGAYEHIVLETEPLIAVLPVAHPLARRDKIKLTELATERWVMFPREDNSPIFDRIISVCNDVGFSPNIVQEAGPVHTRLGLVAAGFGVHLVGKSWQKMPYPGIAYVPTEPAATLGLSCYWRRNDPNAMLKLFVDIVRRFELNQALA